ncbi:unnamed protein product [Leptosia nina]|uniref:Uncharacterized protein n=1 Tax=Leptosia nina TaxID=320188 RepID=A0AAV1JCG9_9NEOP
MFCWYSRESKQCLDKQTGVFEFCGGLIFLKDGAKVPLESILSESVSADLSEKDKQYGVAESLNDEPKPGQREKRFYNYFDYSNDFINPQYPTPFRQSISKRHPAQSFGNFGTQDPFDLILSKLDQIASATIDRSYLPPPPVPVPYPTFVPFIYVPKVTCECGSGNQATNDKPTPMNDKTPNKKPMDNTKRPGTNKTVPDFPDRVFDVDDMPDGNDGEDYKDDGEREISFKPVKLDGPLSRPVPPLEHGSVQAGLEPEKPLAAPAGYPTEEEKVVAPEPPTVCERAAISCCHQPRVNFTCFRLQGCSDSEFYRNACLPQNMLPALKKLENEYRKRIGS